MSFIEASSINRVLMPNPYGNNKRRACYQELKKNGIEIVASDRGALPDSWFFDNGFNADSSSYDREKWDYPLTKEENEAVTSYIESLKASNHTLEIQGGRMGGHRLKRKLGINTQKILFVPMQRPEDTTIKFFSGNVSSIFEFANLVDQIADQLAPKGWLVIAKKHPLEKDVIKPKSKNVKYVFDSAHIHDLIEISSAVLLINSGVGVLSMAWGKPVFHFGNAFYSIEGVNKNVYSVYDAVRSIDQGMEIDMESVKRFYNHLLKNVYSFGKFETRRTKEKNGSYRTMTDKIDFRQININLKKLPTLKSSVLLVTSVVPVPIYRGCQTRIDSVIMALMAMGHSVGLVVLNDSFKAKRSIDIKESIISAYPSISYVDVVASPKYSRRIIDKLSLLCNHILDYTFRKNNIKKFSATPKKFKRLVRRAIKNFKPKSVLVNYAKISDVIPKDFEGIKVIDTHDYQTQIFIENSKNKNEQSAKINNFKRSEFSTLNKYDKVIAINSKEHSVFRKNISSEVFCIPAYCPIPEPKPNYLIGNLYDLDLSEALQNLIKKNFMVY